jgi:hypothetical protein
MKSETHRIIIDLPIDIIDKAIVLADIRFQSRKRMLEQNIIEVIEREYSERNSE